VIFKALEFLEYIGSYFHNIPKLSQQFEQMPFRGDNYEDLFRLLGMAAAEDPSILLELP
jgi:hypothetical protein